jgi:hypothetical protein
MGSHNGRFQGVGIGTADTYSASPGESAAPWPLLVEAVDRKIEDQAKFIRWWDENVRRKGEREASISQSMRYRLATLRRN